LIAKVQNIFESKEVFEEKDIINCDLGRGARQRGSAALGFFIFHFEYAVV